MGAGDEKIGVNSDEGTNLDHNDQAQENPEEMLKGVMNEASSILNDATEVAARTFGLQNEVAGNVDSSDGKTEGEKNVENSEKKEEEEKKWEVFIGFDASNLGNIKQYEAILASKKISIVVENGQVSLVQGITKKVLDKKIQTGNLENDINDLLRKELAKTEYQKIPGGQLGEMAEKLVKSDNPALKGVGALMMMMAKYNILLDVFSFTAYTGALDDKKYEKEKFGKDEIRGLWDRLFGNKNFTGNDEVQFTPDEMRYDYPRLSTLWVWNQLFPGSENKVVEPKNLGARLRKRVPILNDENKTEYVKVFNEQSIEDFKANPIPGTILFCSMETGEVEGEYGDMLGQTIVTMIVGNDGILRYFDKVKNQVVEVNKGDIGEAFKPKAIYSPDQINFEKSVAYISGSDNSIQGSETQAEGEEKKTGEGEKKNSEDGKEEAVESENELKGEKNDATVDLVNDDSTEDTKNKEDNKEKDSKTTLSDQFIKETSE